MKAYISELRLKVVIGPTSSRWPAPDASPMWRSLHEAVRKAREQVATADKAILAVEKDRMLSDLGRVQKIGGIGLKAINELAAVTGIARAEAAVQAYLNKIDETVPQLADSTGSSASADAFATSICDHCRTQTKYSPFLWAMQHRSDPRTYAAIAAAPPYLSGLSDAEHAKFIGSAQGALRPAAAKEAEKALDQVQMGIRSAERMIYERAQAGLLKTGSGYEIRLATKSTPKKRVA